MNLVPKCFSQPVYLRRMWANLMIVFIAWALGESVLRGQETTTSDRSEITIDEKIHQLADTSWAEVMNQVQEAMQTGDHEKWLETVQASLAESHKLTQDLQGVAEVISTAMLGEYYLTVGERQKAEEQFHSALQLAEAAGALPEDTMMLQIGLRLHQLYQEPERAEDGLALLENGWKSLQKAKDPLPRHIIAYGSALIHNLVKLKEFGKAKRVADRLDAQIGTTEGLDPNLEVVAKSSIVIAWSKAGKGERALNHMRRVDHLLESVELQPWAVELTLHAGVAYGQSVKDVEITSHFEAGLQRLRQQMLSPSINETDIPLREIPPTGSDADRLQVDNRREMLLMHLDQVDSDLQFAETRLAQVSAQVAADYEVDSAMRDYAYRNAGRIGAMTGIPGILEPHQQDMHLQFEQHQLQLQVQSLRMKKSQIEQLLQKR